MLKTFVEKNERLTWRISLSCRLGEVELKVEPKAGAINYDFVQPVLPNSLAGFLMKGRTEKPRYALHSSIFKKKSAHNNPQEVFFRSRKKVSKVIIFVFYLTS